VPQDASGLEFFPKRYVLRPKLIRLCLTILDPIDNSLPSIADFPAFRDIGTHSPQEVFYLCFRDLFQYNPALQDTPSLEKLDELYIESLGRYFGKQACVAKAALLKAPTGLNIFIKTNTVLISEAFLGSDVAKMKPYVQILRAFSSMHAFNILKNVVSPDTLRSAKLEHLIKIIVLLALCTEQTLDLIERREQPPIPHLDRIYKFFETLALRRLKRPPETAGKHLLEGFPRRHNSARALARCRTAASPPK
jgi:hypothetical protein